VGVGIGVGTLPVCMTVGEDRGEMAGALLPHAARMSARSINAPICLCFIDGFILSARAFLLVIAQVFNTLYD